MKELDKIANSNDTDKGSKFHNYTRWYGRYFDGLREKNVNLLEIGVSYGGSIKMWEEYFPSADITGIDINPKCKESETERSKILIGNQLDQDFLKRVGDTRGPFDIIIDDGYHSSGAITTSFNSLWPYLKSGGIYAIEDLHCIYLQENDRALMKFLSDTVDVINLNGKTNKGDFDKTDKTKLTQLELELESIHHYLGICFIFKR